MEISEKNLLVQRLASFKRGLYRLEELKEQVGNTEVLTLFTHVINSYKQIYQVVLADDYKLAQLHQLDRYYLEATETIMRDYVTMMSMEARLERMQELNNRIVPFLTTMQQMLDQYLKQLDEQPNLALQEQITELKKNMKEKPKRLWKRF